MVSDLGPFCLRFYAIRFHLLVRCSPCRALYCAVLATTRQKRGHQPLTTYCPGAVAPCGSGGRLPPPPGSNDCATVRWHMPHGRSRLTRPILAAHKGVDHLALDEEVAVARPSHVDTRNEVSHASRHRYRAIEGDRPHNGMLFTLIGPRKPLVPRVRRRRVDLAR
eukprot:scaffold13879_cov142-Isochrysis_galbana.AAC.3